ncbi:MAG: cytochrome c oxidase subunit II [Candidatus Xenobia bacterium]
MKGASFVHLCFIDFGPLFSPASPQARAIFELSIGTTLVLLVILAIVVGVLCVALWRFRATDGDAPQIYGNKVYEALWTAIPFCIVIVLTVGGGWAMMKSHDPNVGGQAPDVVVIGHQWWWEVQYPKAPANLVTANEVHLPVGRDSLILLQSADVIHDFWVPQLGPKQDMLPGPLEVAPSRDVPTGRHLGDTYLVMNPDQPGVYDGTCAEFCGNDHAWMRIRVRADNAADFDRWEQADAKAEPAPHSADAQAGAALFVSKSCVDCHSVPGTHMIGMAAPDLSWLADRTTLGSGRMPNSPEDLAKWLTDPQQWKPQCNMPNFHLTPVEIRELVAYLWRPAEHEEVRP